jgi:Na+/melibiose symporter-like transporter
MNIYLVFLAFISTPLSLLMYFYTCCCVVNSLANKLIYGKVQKTILISSIVFIRTSSTMEQRHTLRVGNNFYSVELCLYPIKEGEVWFVCSKILESQYRKTFNQPTPWSRVFLVKLLVFNKILSDWQLQEVMHLFKN